MSKGSTIAILPLGATEQHGPHLPFETDSIIAEAVVSRAVSRLSSSCEADVLAVEAIGYSVEHMDVSGTKSLSYGEAIDRWIGIGAEQKSRGISKFAMLNAHGGNSPLMTVVATELRVRHSMLAVATSWHRFGYPEGLVSDKERAIGIHGGLVETSLMLALRPELVDMSKAGDFASNQSDYAGNFRHLRAYGQHAFGWKMSDLNPIGAVGDAAAATAEAGERILDHAAAGFAELLLEMDRFDIADFS